MNRRSSILAPIFVLALAASALAEPAHGAADTVFIPLDQIWAFRIPGTRDILELEPKARSKEYWDGIIQAFMSETSPHWPRPGKPARPAFAVSGRGIDALRQAHEVLVDGATPRQSFNADDDVSLVFVSYPSQCLLDIREVERIANRITIKYRPVLRREKILSAHLALIPLGKLPAGTYEVEIDEQPMGQQLPDGGYAAIDSNAGFSLDTQDAGKRFVSGPFSFTVVEKEKK